MSLAGGRDPAPAAPAANARGRKLLTIYEQADWIHRGALPPP